MSSFVISLVCDKNELFPKICLFRKRLRQYDISVYAFYVQSINYVILIILYFKIVFKSIHFHKTIFVKVTFIWHDSDI